MAASEYVEEISRERVQDAFGTFDPSGTGYVTRYQFSVAVKCLGIDVVMDSQYPSAESINYEQALTMELGVCITGEGEGVESEVDYDATEAEVESEEDDYQGELTEMESAGEEEMGMEEVEREVSLPVPDTHSPTPSPQQPRPAVVGAEAAGAGRSPYLPIAPPRDSLASDSGRDADSESVTDIYERERAKVTRRRSGRGRSRPAERELRSRSPLSRSRTALEVYTGSGSEGDREAEEEERRERRDRVLEEEARMELEMEIGAQNASETASYSAGDSLLDEIPTSPKTLAEEESNSSMSSPAPDYSTRYDASLDVVVSLFRRALSAIQTQREKEAAQCERDRVKCEEWGLRSRSPSPTASPRGRRSPRRSPSPRRMLSGSVSPGRRRSPSPRRMSATTGRSPSPRRNNATARSHRKCVKAGIMQMLTLEDIRGTGYVTLVELIGVLSRCGVQLAKGETHDLAEVLCPPQPLSATGGGRRLDLDGRTIPLQAVGDIVREARLDLEQKARAKREREMAEAKERGLTSLALPLALPIPERRPRFGSPPRRKQNPKPAPPSTRLIAPVTRISPVPTQSSPFDAKAKGQARGAPKSPSLRPSPPVSLATLPGSDKGHLVQALARVSRRNSGARPGSELRRLLSAQDTYKSGRVSQEQLVSALSSLSLSERVARSTASALVSGEGKAGKVAIASVVAATSDLFVGVEQPTERERAVLGGVTERQRERARLETERVTQPSTSWYAWEKPRTGRGGGGGGGGGGGMGSSSKALRSRTQSSPRPSPTPFDGRTHISPGRRRPLQSCTQSSIGRDNVSNVVPIRPRSPVRERSNPFAGSNSPRGGDILLPSRGVINISHGSFIK
ncbi:hypothetical protein KIPB_000706 [Kipferlia bialata]|uniref:EF-hand domain-containing protein n=1 Tax=Kipferlia bialata TaxID=797122 RepID=A0A9K3CPL6_9EUKA|nr:hypothetical protein KIPB_000706 [Kipferlia bialata]|eukprot:g706.t1